VTKSQYQEGMMPGQFKSLD